MKLFEIISLNVLWSSRREKKKNIWGRVAGIGLNLVVKTIVKKNNFDIIEKKKICTVTEFPFSFTAQ
jgi:hypothetical protein